MLILFQCSVSFAQVSVVPLDYPANLKNEEKSPDPSRATASLTLPFFDDFSTSKTDSLNSANWIPGSGVYINNTLSGSHPSINIATFDGLNASGVPYNLVNPLTQNFTDTLTSQPIDLAGQAGADSIYMSFYWMAKGLGELPDSSDFLRLEFLNKTGEWITVWNQVGYETDTLFHQKFIAIGDSLFFHEGFKFRFRSYGRNSGGYDTWHLDYIYINAKRSVNQPYLFDVSMRMPISPFLKKYTAMPLRQYKVNPAEATSDSIRTDVVNHFNNFNILTSTLTVSDEQRGTEFQRTVQRSIYVESLNSKTFSAKLTAPAINDTFDSVRLHTKFYVITTDTIPNVNLKNNDTITSSTALTDYYAYDDGSAEYGVQVNQKLGRVGVQYVLSKPDTIGGVRMAMVRFNKDIAGQSFTVQIFNNKNGKPDQMIAQRSVSVRYPSGRNGFVDYAFTNPVAVADTFYVGWLQINEQPVTVGFDRNSMYGKDAVYYNLGTEWVKETSLDGSVMIRPYLGKKAQGIITGAEPIPDRNGSFFPNPNKGVLNWKNASFKKIDIYTIQGMMVESIRPDKGQQAVSLEHLVSGIYLLKASDGKQLFVQKMLISK